MRKILIFLLMQFCGAAHGQVVYFSSPPFTLVNGARIDATQVMANYNRIISDGNTAYTAFLAQISSIGSGGTPAHAVVPFNLAACPAGWAAADGTGGTADMRGRFAMETNGGYSAGTILNDQIQDHTHFIPGTFVQQLSFFSSNFFTTGPQNFFPVGQSAISIGNPNVGNHGSETRPKNLALLYCEKS